MSFKIYRTAVKKEFKKLLIAKLKNKNIYSTGLADAKIMDYIQKVRSKNYKDFILTDNLIDELFIEIENDLVL